MNPATILVTGGAGFIGSNFIRTSLLRDPTVRIVNLDSLTYAGNLESLTDVAGEHGVRGDNRYRFGRGDVRDAETPACLLAGHPPREAAPPPPPPPPPPPAPVPEARAPSGPGAPCDD